MYYVYVCEADNDITLIYTARRCMRPLPEGGRAGRLFDMIIKQTDNKMENELPKRKPTRLKNFDYSTPGAYFITMCTKNRKCILSRVGDPVRDDVKGVPQNAQIVGDDVHDVPYNVQNNVHLSHYGKIADEYIQRLNGFYGNINVDAYVIMPNHIHMILRVFDSGTSRTSSPTSIIIN